MGEGARYLGTVLLLALLVVAPGCGGGDSTDSSTEKEALYPWLKGPSREFLVRHADNYVQTFGEEATKAEREQASRVVDGWMKARAAKDWEKDCSYFSRRYAKILTVDANGVTKGKVKSCPEALAFFGPNASGDFKNNNFDGSIDSLRIEDDLGYAQYHGIDGKDWVITLDREGDRWMVGIAAPINRFR